MFVQRQRCVFTLNESLDFHYLRLLCSRRNFMGCNLCNLYAIATMIFWLKMNLSGVFEDKVLIKQIHLSCSKIIHASKEAMAAINKLHHSFAKKGIFHKLETTSTKM